MQVTVETCTQLRINDLQKKVRKILATEYPSITEEQVYNITYAEFRKFVINDQTFDFKGQRNYLGGYRWYFVCPKCGNNANKLLMPPQWATNKTKQYWCKTCHGIKNQSVVMGQSSMYQKVTKPLKRMRDIEDKVAAGHIGMEKVQELLDEYERIEHEMEKSPEYRLYMFKKKHGMLPQSTISRAVQDAGKPA